MESGLANVDSALRETRNPSHRSYMACEILDSSSRSAKQRFGRLELRDMLVIAESIIDGSGCQNLFWYGYFSKFVSLSANIVAANLNIPMDANASIQMVSVMSKAMQCLQAQPASLKLLAQLLHNQLLQLSSFQWTQLMLLAYKYLTQNSDCISAWGLYHREFSCWNAIDITRIEAEASALQVIMLSLQRIEHFENNVLQAMTVFLFTTLDRCVCNKRIFISSYGQSRCVSILRCMCILVSKSKGSQLTFVPRMIDLFPKLLQSGVSRAVNCLPAGDAIISQTSPFRSGRLEISYGYSPDSVDTMMSCISFLNIEENESSIMDMDTPILKAQLAFLHESPSLRVRLNSLALLQAVIKAEPKKLQDYWRYLLPLRSPYQAFPYTASLATVALFDDNAKVRAAAATTVVLLLDGAGQRAHMSVAEFCPNYAIGFIPQSVQIGQLLICLHAVLMKSLHCESDLQAKTCILRTLGTVLSGSPYDRLPAIMPSEVFFCVQSTMVEHDITSADESALLPLIFCAGSVLSLKGAVHTIKGLLLQDMHLSFQHQHLPHLIYLLSKAALPIMPPAIRGEAMIAIHSGLKNYPDLMRGAWQLIEEILESMDSNSSEARSPRETKNMQLSFRLVESYLMLSPCKSMDDRNVGISYACSIGRIWVRCIELCLKFGFRHHSPMVRSASQSLMQWLPLKICDIISESVLEQIVAEVSSMASQDPEASVRAAGFRSLAAVIRSAGLCQDDVFLRRHVLPLLQIGLKDRVLSVRIAASVALNKISSTKVSQYIEELSDTGAFCDSMESLLNLVLISMQDNDKVCSNGLIALASVVKVVKFNLEPCKYQLIKTFCSLTKCFSKVKALWTVCSATSNLLRNTSIFLDSNSIEFVESLLRRSITLVKESTNSKIRIYATDVIISISMRQHYGSVYCTILKDMIVQACKCCVQPLDLNSQNLALRTFPPVLEEETTFRSRVMEVKLEDALLHLLSLSQASDAVHIKEELLSCMSVLQYICTKVIQAISPGKTKESSQEGSTSRDSTSEAHVLAAHCDNDSNSNLSYAEALSCYEVACTPHIRLQGIKCLHELYRELDTVEPDSAWSSANQYLCVLLRNFHK